MQLLEAFYPVKTDSTMYWRTLKSMKDQLTKQHGFILSTDDFAAHRVRLHVVLPGRTRHQLQLRLADSAARNRGMPSFADLMVATDAEGLNRGFLANEQHYGVVRQLQLRNLIVPVVGDFAGPKALRAVGDFLRAYGAVASAIYTSNVEQYLFREPHKWRQYYDNVATLPIDSTSTFRPRGLQLRLQRRR